MRFQTKGFTSLLLTLAFLALSFSGVLLYVTPRGRMANWTGWTLLGLEKGQWQSVHTNIAILFMLVAVLHIAFNWSMLWCYIKKRGSLALNMKWELLVAVVVAAVVLVGSILEWPPFRSVMIFNDQIKDYWEREPTTAPAPHAEELTLDRLASQMGLSTERVLEALGTEGIAATGPGVTVSRVATENGLTPAEIHAAIKKHFPEAQEAGHGPGRGYGRGRGQGRGMGRGVGE
ncbi:MAG: DUF4405 domain-containing protein [Thermoguttaceae bacterium]|jgi:hypothetical protein